MFLWTMRALTAVMVSAAGLHLLAGDEPFLPAPARAELTPEERAELQAGPDPAEVDHDLKARQEFTVFIDHLLAEVIAGRMPAREARDQLYYYCLAHYPKHLQHLQFFEAGDTARA